VEAGGGIQSLAESQEVTESYLSDVCAEIEIAE
jgi:hypothetical protein